jgi:hypothetical protein
LISVIAFSLRKLRFSGALRLENSSKMNHFDYKEFSQPQSRRVTCVYAELLLVIELSYSKIKLLQ